MATKQQWKQEIKTQVLNQLSSMGFETTRLRVNYIIISRGTLNLEYHTSRTKCDKINLCLYNLENQRYNFINFDIDVERNTVCIEKTIPGEENKFTYTSDTYKMVTEADLPIFVEPLSSYIVNEIATIMSNLQTRGVI